LNPKGCELLLPHSINILRLHTIGGPDIRRASDRIASDFLKLLEQQFQQSDKRRPIELRYPAQFAERMNIHVNHLNRALKETLRESTTQVISHWVLSEAKKRLDEHQVFAIGRRHPLIYITFPAIMGLPVNI
jgi:hypothetical protein